MRPKLPVTSGKDVIRAFRKIGYQVTRQRGSHVRLRDETDPRHKPITVPVHRQIKPGLLRSLIKDAGLSVEEFLLILKD